jgi:hypothetical protein
VLASFINFEEYEKVLVHLFGVCIKILFAKINEDAAIIVAASLITKKAPMFVPTMPAMTGFNSEAPEYETPITVVKQSIDPIMIRSKLGINCAFNI